MRDFADIDCRFDSYADAAVGSGISCSLRRDPDGYHFWCTIAGRSAEFVYGPEFVPISDRRVRGKDIFSVFILLHKRMVETLASHRDCQV